MTKPIKNELSLQVYGDPALHKQLLVVLAETFGTVPKVRNEKDYETKAGRSGHYKQITIKLEN